MLNFIKMDDVGKIGLGEEARIIQKVIHKRGHWGSHGNGDNGWIGYVIVFAIVIVSFLFLILLS